MGWASDNVPLMAMYAIGAWLFVPLGWHWALTFIAVAILSNLWFIASICSHCVNYGKEDCPSGYGKLSARLSKKGAPKDFPRAFNRNIWVVALGWALPFVAGIISVVRAFGNFLELAYSTIPLVAFCAVAFYVVPEMSKDKCRRCAMRKSCPGARLTGTPAPAKMNRR